MRIEVLTGRCIGRREPARGGLRSQVGCECGVHVLIGGTVSVYGLYDPQLPAPQGLGGGNHLEMEIEAGVMQIRQTCNCIETDVEKWRWRMSRPKLLSGQTADTLTLDERN
jgi:hypothetical protein